MTDPDDFYEDDEPVEDILAEWNAPGEKHLTAPPHGYAQILDVTWPDRGLNETLEIPDDLRSLDPVTDIPSSRLAAA